MQLANHTRFWILPKIWYGYYPKAGMGKIPYPELLIDYKQNEVVQELQMKDVLCTREDWISRGRLDYTIWDDHDEEGQELLFQHATGFLS